MKTLLLTINLCAAMIAFASCGQTANVNTNSAMNHNSMSHGNMNHSQMNHNALTNGNSDRSGMSEMKSSPDAASQPFDLQFIDSMTHHHDGAIQMAEMALKKSQNEELKKFAQKIIDDQRKENAQMKEWREKWYTGKPAAINMEMPGMKDSMKMMANAHMKMMEAAGKDFDVHFLDVMIPHHEGAVEMAKDALQKAERQEIKTLANQIIKEQEAEIKKMREWKAAWNK